MLKINDFRIISGILLSFLLIIWTYWLTKTWINNDAWTIWNDTWTYNYSIASEISTTSDYINNWKRWELTWSWFVTSELFWDFSSLNISLHESTRSDCTTWQTYTLVSSGINSEFFWDMNVLSSSYFCPNTQELKLTLNSTQLWNKDIFWTDSTFAFNIFEKQEISINGVSYLKWDLSNLTTNTETLIQTGNINTKINIEQQLNKNIETITRNIPEEDNIDTINNFTNNTDSDKYYLYNFEWTIWSTIQYWINWLDYPNKWKKVTIDKSWDNKVAIEWNNTLIVKWWNVYIKSNIYNKDDTTDLLVISAKKDDNWNGWNIYIDPDVTNIDAIIIADWSLLSYGWNLTWILDKKTSPDALHNQLLIYGSVHSKNTIWSWDEIPFGSDLYGDGSNTLENNIYDLINLRNFQLTYASNNIAVTCWWDESLWVPIDSNWVNTYAWAGQRECFNDLITSTSDSRANWDSDLKTTDKYNPLVIEYNPNIIYIDPFILRNN